MHIAQESPKLTSMSLKIFGKSWDNIKVYSLKRERAGVEEGRKEEGRKGERGT